MRVVHSLGDTLGAVLKLFTAAEEVRQSLPEANVLWILEATPPA